MESPCRVATNIMDCDIQVSSRSSRTNTFLGKGMNPFFNPAKG